MTHITVERNASGCQDKPKLSRKHSVDSDGELDSTNDDKSFRTRSISLFSRRHMALRAISKSIDHYSPPSGEETLDANGKAKKPAMRSNSLPRRCCNKFAFKVLKIIIGSLNLYEFTVPVTAYVAGLLTGE